MSSSGAVLAEQAISSGVTGCYEWVEDEARRIRGDKALNGLTPEYIRQRLHEFIREGGKLIEVPEKRLEYNHRDCWYKAIIPEPGFKYGLFVEIELTDPDPELPCVTLVNAHPQKK